MLIAENISYQAGGRILLDNCTVSVKPGIFTAVVGPNGAGKTSLMKVLSHEHASYNGTVKLNGVVIDCIKHRRLSQLRAVLPQHTTINFPFTIEQVIRIGRYPHQVIEDEHLHIINQVIARTGLDSIRGRTYFTLSGGEKQRVQLARVMAQIWDESKEARYLLLDEPTSSLDLAQQHSLLTLAKGLCERNVGVLAILHDLNLAAQYADEVVFLKEGRIVAQGLTRDVMTSNVIEKTFDHPVKVFVDGYDSYPVIYPISKMNKQKIFDKPVNNYAYEQHTN